MYLGTGSSDRVFQGLFPERDIGFELGVVLKDTTRHLKTKGAFRLKECLLRNNCLYTYDSPILSHFTVHMIDHLKVNCSESYKMETVLNKSKFRQYSVNKVLLIS